MSDKNTPSYPVMKWADKAMYEAAPVATKPSVVLLDMTPRPLQLIAAVSGIYEGKIVDNPTTVTYEEAMRWYDGALRSKIVAPLEWVNFAFFISGVTRAFTHQLVRERHATFAQESLRFAVKSNAAAEVIRPPELYGLPEDHPWVVEWEAVVARIDAGYNGLVNSGFPAESARGLLPTNIGTRVHYRTNLRSLVQHAGMRLCSQAQYEWKEVWSEMLKAILAYGPADDRWQQHAIVRMFRPVCFATGKCEFMGPADRHCDIRERVEAHHRAGELPEVWTDIHPHEALRLGAARKA